MHSTLGVQMTALPIEAWDMRVPAGRIINRLLHRKNTAESLTVMDDDVFIVSYPRSGNTWLRFILANLLHPGEVASFANIERLVPDIHKNSDRDLRRGSRPRLLKSHAGFDPRYPRVVYLCRDPRDVAVSYYYYLLTRSQLASESKEDYLALFVRGQLGHGISWRDHVEGWWGQRRNAENLLLVRYEDMLEDATAQVLRIVAFLGLQTSVEATEKAVGKASFQNMRESEKVDGHKHRATRHTKDGVPFVRSGSKGQWRKELPPGHAQTILESWGGTMQKLGYSGE